MVIMKIQKINNKIIKILFLLPNFNFNKDNNENSKD